MRLEELRRVGPAAVPHELLPAGDRQIARPYDFEVPFCIAHVLEAKDEYRQTRAGMVLFETPGKHARVRQPRRVRDRHEPHFVVATTACSLSRKRSCSMSP